MTANDSGGIIQRALGWLRRGYPDGVPATDYVALLGVLRRRLTDEDIEAVVAQLADEQEQEGAITRAHIRELIRQHTLQPPTDEDVARVSGHLKAGGWEPEA